MKSASTTLFANITEAIDKLPEHERKDYMVWHTHHMHAILVDPSKEEVMDDRLMPKSVRIVKGRRVRPIQFTKQRKWADGKLTLFYELRQPVKTFKDIIFPEDQLFVVGSLRDPLSRRISNFIHNLDCQTYVDTAPVCDREMGMNFKNSIRDGTLDVNVLSRLPQLMQSYKDGLITMEALVEDFLSPVPYGSELPEIRHGFTDIVHWLTGCQVDLDAIGTSGFHQAHKDASHVFVLKMERMQEVIPFLETFLGLSLDMSKRMRVMGNQCGNCYIFDLDAKEVSQELYRVASRNANIIKLYENEIVCKLGYRLAD